LEIIGTASTLTILIVRFLVGAGGGGTLPFNIFAGEVATVGSAADVVEMALIASSHGFRHIRAHGLR